MPQTADLRRGQVVGDASRRFVRLAVDGEPNQAIALTGDATGSGTSSIPVTLSATGVAAGSYTNTNLTVDGKGRITLAANGAGGTGGSGTVTSVAAGTGLAASPSPIVGAGTVSLVVPVSVANGGTGATTLTARAVLVGEGTGAVGFAAAGTAGRLLVDQGAGADPAFVALSGDATLTGSGVIALTANSVGTADITNANVTYAKIQNVTAARLLGNPTGGAAAPSEISLGTGLSFAGTVLNATGGATGLSGMTAGQIPIAATATTITSSANLSGDVTSNATLVTTIAANAVSDAKLRQGAGLTVIGRSANTTGNVADIVGAANGVLRVSGTTLAFGAVDISTAQVSGTLPTARGGTNLGTWTTGSIPYLSSATQFAQDNANLFWDGSNHRLGIGTTTPAGVLQVNVSPNPTALSVATVGGLVVMSPGTSTGMQLGAYDVSGGYGTFLQARNHGAVSTAYALALNPLGGNVGIGMTPGAARLDVNGTVNLGGLTASGGADLVIAWATTTPTPTASSGTFTSATASTRYKQFGKLVFITISVTITTNGTAAGQILVPLPVNALTTIIQSLGGINTAGTGKGLTGYLGNGNNVVITTYDFLYPGASGYGLQLSGIYEAA